MNSTIDRWIDRHGDEIVSELCKSIRFPSVSVDGAGDAPLGEECRKALNHALELCRGFGFATRDLDGYIGIADYGDGVETLGVLAHLDVVPAGEGWTHDPFGGEVKDGVLFGRGASDDKGAAIAMIYALAAIKASGLTFRRKVRLLFGCDEERTMKCINYYKAHEPIPELSFSPDSSYPLINAEKSFLFAQYSRRYPSGISLNGGVMAGGVPGTAEATIPVPYDAVLASANGYAARTGYGVAVERRDGCTQLTVTGVPAFGSMPYKGKNALQGMLGLLNELPLPEEDAKSVAGLWNSFHTECYGESLGLDLSDDSGRFTLALCCIHWNSEGFTIKVDIRAPICAGYELVSDRLDAAMALAGATRTQCDYSQGYLMSEDTELVRGLQKVYTARMHLPATPVRSGGGTYARHLPNAVGFGPKRADHPTRIHSAEESVLIADLIEDAKLIADAIIELAVLQ